MKIKFITEKYREAETDHFDHHMPIPRVGEWVHFSTLVEGMVKYVSYEYTETDCVVTVQLAYV